MTSVRLSKQGIDRFRELLDAAMCDRMTLLRHLASLDYELAPDLDGEVERDATGYILLPPRYCELINLEIPSDVTDRLTEMIQDLPIGSIYPGSEPWRVMLDAILQGIVIPKPYPPAGGDPTAPIVRPALHPPQKIVHEGSKRPMLRLSREARTGLERLALVQPALSGDTPQFSRTLRQLAGYRWEWNTPRREVRFLPRFRYQIVADPYVLEYLAAEGLRLGFPAHQGGRRTPLAIASNVLEAIGQGILIPAGLREWKPT
jgi:hypothetical protein